MSLLLESDYEYLKTTGLRYSEDAANHFLIIENFSVEPGLYHSSDLVEITEIEVLVVIPDNYNMSGTDMLWLYPSITRVDGVLIPNANTTGGSDNRMHAGKEYCRWSRHYTSDSWKPKIDNVEKILSRIEWALKNPSA